MREQQYCITQFNDKFSALKKEKIALYGSGEIARELVNRYPDYQIECLVDDAAPGRYVSGHYVVTFSQFLELHIKHLIIVTECQETEKIYAKICSECRANHIEIYSFYGRNLFSLHEEVVRRNMRYPQLKESDLKKAIEAHEVISFDISDVLLTPKHISILDFYDDMGANFNKLKIRIDNFAEKAINIRNANPENTIEEVVKQLLHTERIFEKEYANIEEVIYEVVKSAFVPRKIMVNTLKDALEKGKKICLVEDMPEYRFSKEMWMKLFNAYEISGFDFFVSGTELLLNKRNGLFWILKERYNTESCLHIGDECETDILLPQMYDIDTFLVKSPSDLFKNLDPMGVGMLDYKKVRVLFEKYMLAVYNDVYLMEQAEKNCREKRKLAVQVEKEIEFFRNCSEVVTYEPILMEEIEEQSDIEDYSKLIFQSVEKPQVSIVIPVFNQFCYTYKCLKSILEHTEKTPYEVIIADDCSTDQVKELEKVVSGITVIHNKENLKFLLNCNHAAEYAKGEYILFLNNDTQVQPNWLRPLVELMERRPDAGMVGSKLVYPQGPLQEAGGILWKDGSAWNYGHLKNPQNAEFAYVKEADYISGAAIMIRASLWKEIGGFDTTFVPAYYEDTDLAFEVRKHGYKVLLQPASVVVHFEGVSNGTDTSSGLKNYQVVNQRKFFEKWKEVLEAEHFENGTNVYLAKDRGQTKKQILVVDHYVPNFDKDAGGRCTYMYIKMFLKLGMKVTFIGDNYAKTEPYTTDLNQMGVEVLYGDYYYLHWQEWLKENLKYFDYVYLQRPHISIKYMDLVKEYGRGKIFYFAHDLHHVRMYRDYLVSGNEDALKESEHWKKIEMELFEKTDVGHVVGSYEQEIMQKAFPEKPIRNIPLYIYDDEPDCIEKDFSKRKDILFVGGFNHTPNIDAVLWFGKEIFPKILEKYPDMVWHIVGSNAPAEVKALANEHIILEGFVSDEELGELYRKCRLVVVPLRYGAGVKGKIVEAAYYQIPVVTTAIGGEGLDAEVGSFVMEDDAEKMAALVETLYTDYEELRKMSDAGRTMIQKYFTSKAAEQVLLADMDLE